MKAIFKKEGASHSMIIPAVSVILPDGTFKTTSLGNKMNSFGRDMSEGLYLERYEHPHIHTVKIITPLIPYELFERTNNPKECNLLSIDYYMGVDSKKVIEYLGGKMFIIDDDIPVSERIPNTEEYKFGRFNSIMQYTGWEHILKSPELAKYEGDKYTRIELSNECKYTMFKSLGIKEAYKRV